MFFPQRLFNVLVGAASFSLVSTLLPVIQFTHLPVKPSSLVLAGVTQGYVPPLNLIRRLQRTEAGGSRGCSENIPVSLNLLIPKDHVPITISSHPSFLWHVSNAIPVTTRFTLVEPGVSKPILSKELKVVKPGIVQVKVPPDAPELVEGKEYRWTVSIICNERRPSENIYARAWVKRVPRTPELIQKLATATNESKRGLIYAQSGVWYDATSELYKAYTAHQEDRLTASHFLKLLDQVGLTKIASHERQRINVNTPAKAK